MITAQLVTSNNSCRCLKKAEGGIANAAMQPLHFSGPCDQMQPFQSPKKIQPKPLENIDRPAPGGKHLHLLKIAQSSGRPLLAAEWESIQRQLLVVLIIEWASKAVHAAPSRYAQACQ